MDESVASTVKEGYLELVTRHPDLYDNLYRHDRNTLLQLLVMGSLPEPVKEMIRGLRRRPVMETIRGLSVPRGLLDRILFTFLILSLTGRFPADKIVRRLML